MKEKFYTIKEVADHFKVSVRHIYRQIDQDKFPKAIKMGKRSLFAESHILAYMDNLLKTG